MKKGQTQKLIWAWTRGHDVTAVLLRLNYEQSIRRCAYSTPPC